MSKSPTLSRAQHCVAAVVGLLASLAAACALAPAAFAERMLPVDSGTGAVQAAHSGTPGWEIALITIGAVMLIGLVVAVVLRRRTSTRLQSAVS